MLFSQLIKADSVLLYFEGNYSFSLHCCFQFTRTHTEGETPDTNCIAKVNILAHIVAQHRGPAPLYSYPETDLPSGISS